MPTSHTPSTPCAGNSSRPKCSAPSNSSWSSRGNRVTSAVTMISEKKNLLHWPPRQMSHRTPQLSLRQRTKRGRPCRRIPRDPAFLQRLKPRRLMGLNRIMKPAASLTDWTVPKNPLQPACTNRTAPSRKPTRPQESTMKTISVPGWNDAFNQRSGRILRRVWLDRHPIPENSRGVQGPWLTVGRGCLNSGRDVFCSLLRPCHE